MRTVRVVPPLPMTVTVPRHPTPDYTDPSIEVSHRNAVEAGRRIAESLANAARLSRDPGIQSALAHDAACLTALTYFAVRMQPSADWSGDGILHARFAISDSVLATSNEVLDATIRDLRDYVGHMIDRKRREA